MKKLLLSLSLVLLATVATFANTFQVINMTNCTYEMSTQAGYLTVTPGYNQTFTTGNYFGAKIMRGGILAYQINVGVLPVVPTTQTVISSTVGDAPACNNGLPYTVVYTANNSLNIIILIF